MTPPDVLPVDLDTAKVHERIDLNYLADDTSIESMLNTATRLAEEFTRRAFITQTWIFETTCLGPIIEIPRPRLQQVIANSDDSESMFFTDWNNVQYPIQDDAWFINTIYEPGRLIFKPGFSPLPFGFSNGWWGAGWGGFLTLQFDAGYGDNPDDVPFPIKEGILQIFGHLYENREGQPLYPGSFAYELLRPFQVEYL
jgi:hypothetical protein